MSHHILARLDAQPDHERHEQERPADTKSVDVLVIVLGGTES